MLRFVIRKMLSNKWMVACLVIGTVLAVAMVASVPMYTEGVLQRMLIKDMEAAQEQSRVHSGNVALNGNVYYLKIPVRLDAYETKQREIEAMADSLPVPVIARYHQLVVDYVYGLPPGTTLDDEDVKRKFIKLSGIQDYENKLSIIKGRMPAKEPVDGVYEVMVTPATIKRQDILLDQEYVMYDTAKRRPELVFPIKVVGVCEPTDLSDPFWSGGTARLDDGAVMDDKLLYRDFVVGENTLLINIYWNYVFDYHQLKLIDLPAVTSAVSLLTEQVEVTPGFKTSIPALETLRSYVRREAQLKLTLWVLQAPILMMLAFYLFMVAQLIVDYEKNEIAVLKSRGASRAQVVKSYVLESFIISLVAIGTGPYLSLLICKMIGASNGFLEFVQRVPLPIELGINAYLYGGAALVFSMLAMLIPALISSRTSIVEHKRRRSSPRRAFMFKFIGGAALVALALYGRYSYNLRQTALLVSGADAMVVPVDPMLFIMSTLFILGVGLLLLSLHPLLIRFLFTLGKRIWSPAFYASFVQVGRSSGQAQFLMLFLILTLAVGIFSANSARTINANTEERIMYENGADIVLTSEWANDAPPAMGPGGPPVDDPLNSKPLNYREPDYFRYKSVKGFTETARVFTTEESMVSTAGRGKSIRAMYMAFFPWEFGRVAWSRPGLLRYPINDYLNVLTQTPNAVFLSTALQEQLECKVGDMLYVSWSQQQMVVQVAGFIDYWPSINPFTQARVDGQQAVVKRPYLVGNMRYLNARMRLEPYRVWASRAPEATSAEIYEDIKEKKLAVTGVRDSRQDLIKAKNDPTLMGLNGALTMGFLVTMLISAIGFMIYWVLSIKSRVLQMGILRAMGMRMRSLIVMLGMEQILISFLSILSGIVVGGLTCDLFVPMLEVAFSAASRVPEFHVVMMRDDYRSIYMIVSVTLVVGFLMLGVIISRIRISQALKLGED